MHISGIELFKLNVKDMEIILHYKHYNVKPFGNTGKFCSEHSFEKVSRQLFGWLYISANVQSYIPPGLLVEVTCFFLSWIPTRQLVVFGFAAWLQAAWRWHCNQAKLWSENGNFLFNSHMESWKEETMSNSVQGAKVRLCLDYDLTSTLINRNSLLHNIFAQHTFFNCACPQ